MKTTKKARIAAALKPLIVMPRPGRDLEYASATGTSSFRLDGISERERIESNIAVTKAEAARMVTTADEILGLLKRAEIAEERIRILTDWARHAEAVIDHHNKAKA